MQIFQRFFQKLLAFSQLFPFEAEIHLAFRCIVSHSVFITARAHKTIYFSLSAGGENQEGEPVV